MFLILFGIVSVMKYLFLTTVALISLSSSVFAQENPMFNHSFHSFKHWGNSHWKNQNFTSSIHPPAVTLRTTPQTSMFDNISKIAPADFIANLKNAKIIKGAYHRRYGPFNHHISPDVIIELDENFYTLSYGDQKIVTELLAESYNQDHYMLKDANTRNIVGQITPEGFHLF